MHSFMGSISTLSKQGESVRVGLCLAYYAFWYTPMITDHAFSQARREQSGFCWEAGKPAALCHTCIAPPSVSLIKTL